MIHRVLSALCRRLDLSLLYETKVGIKGLNELVSSDRFGLSALGDARRIPTRELFICPDGLKDSYTLLGAPLELSPHAGLMRSLAQDDDLLETQYLQRVASGTLDWRPPKRPSRRYRDLLKDRFHEKLKRVKAGQLPPVKVMTVKGSHYIADGKHTAALCALLGLDSLCIDVSPVAYDSYLWWVCRKMLRRERHYAKHIAYYTALREGLSGRGHRAYRSRAEIVKDLETHPIEWTGHTYHPIPFPEFSHLRTGTNPRQFEAKWGLVLEALAATYPKGIKGLNILDIGANAGYYTFSLARMGARLTAFEPHPRYAPVGDFLAKESGLNVHWHGVGFDAALLGEQGFDAALMLSVFQWLAQGGRLQDEAAGILRQVSRISRCLIFELGFNKGWSCLKTRRLNHYGEILDLLRRETVYRHFRLIGTTRPWGQGGRQLVLCSNEESLEDPFWRRRLRNLKI